MNIKIMADILKIDAISADVVSIEESNGYIILNFLQTFPKPDENQSQTTNISQVSKNQSDRIGKIVCRVSLSWEHFVRLIPLISKTAKDFEQIAKTKYAEADRILDGVNIRENARPDEKR